jgi:hypothetical protein
MVRHPLLAATFVAAAGSQGLLQGLFLWVVRDVLLAFGDAVSPMSLVTAAATVGGIWILRSGCTYVGEVSQYRLAYKA